MAKRRDVEFGALKCSQRRRYAWACLKATLLRLNVRIAAWSSGRWNHRHAAAAYWRHGDAGIGAGRGTDHAFGCGEPIAQRSAACGFVGAWCSAAARQATTLIRWLRKRRRSSRLLRLSVCDGDKWRCHGRDDGRNVHGSHGMSPRLIENNAGCGIIVPPAQQGGTSIVIESATNQSMKVSGRHTCSSERRSAATPQRHPTNAAAIIKAAPK